MKQFRMIWLMGAMIVTATACQKKEKLAADASAPQYKKQTALASAAGVCREFRNGLPKDTLKGVLYANKTVTNDKEWILDGLVVVQPGVTLTIQPGTLLKGTLEEPAGTSTKPAGGLIISRGAKIMAEGTSTDPIVFTSVPTSANRKAGDWTGILILGGAPTNDGPSARVQGIPLMPGVDPYYGGTNSADNSGILRYVRIEFAGYRLSIGSSSDDYEYGGLVLAGVGSGTTIDHIQVSYSNDDAFEFLGGTVNAKYLIASGFRDDAFSFISGYTGRLQFGLVWTDRLYADPSQSHGFESENRGTVTSALPVTRPVISNFSLMGVQLYSDATRSIPVIGELGVFGTMGNGATWKRNTSFVLRNSIIMGYKKGVVLDNSLGNTQEKYQGTSSPVASLKHNLIQAFETPFAVAAGNYTQAAFQAKAQADGNTGFTGGAPNTSIKLINPFSSVIPSFYLPQPGSPALSGAVFDGDLSDPFFDKTGTFRGAGGSLSWTTCWARFNRYSNY